MPAILPSVLCPFPPPPSHAHLQICAADPVLCKGVSSGQLQVVSNGSGLPVIDLRHLSAELAAAAADADLVVLEGMGRSIETNLHSALLGCVVGVPLTGW